ncbi:MAG TPA: hypothetical protein VHZ07_28305 [Bryobacteraceae bacterium]|jgi:hypothetical protein|nr:hypothetical protein [Bryobacteraceae bacterium]
MSTPARIAANQANAKLSTGPRTEEGRAKSSHNAKDEAPLLSAPRIQQVAALTGRTVLLPTDDVEEYKNHVARFEAEFRPLTGREK